MGFILNILLCFVLSCWNQKFKLHYTVPKAILEKSCFRLGYFSAGWGEKNLKMSYKCQFYFSSISASWVLFHLAQHTSGTPLCYQWLLRKVTRIFGAISSQKLVCTSQKLVHRRSKNLMPTALSQIKSPLSTECCFQWWLRVGICRNRVNKSDTSAKCSPNL